MQILKRTLQSVRALGKNNAAIFDDVYAQNKWGGEGVYSGVGSDAVNSQLYEDFVVSYIESNGIKSIVDVGCGDFQVSDRILNRVPGVSYIGLDVSKIAIENNTARHARDGVQFRQCDAALDPLPKGDLVLVREVLQHLSNRDILAILPKLLAFPHALVSNTQKIGAKPLNKDQASGASSRAVTCGGLWLALPPFNASVEEMLRVRHANKPTEILTEKLL